MTLSMASALRACDFEDSQFTQIVESCLKDFPNVKALRMEQRTCLINLARGKDVFAILPTGFGKSLIFQLFPRVMSALPSIEGRKLMSTIIVVSPLVSAMRDQVEQLKRFGFSAAAIGIGEECEEDEEKVRNGECEIVFGSPESWLSKAWMKELKEGNLGRQTAAIAVHSVTEWYISHFADINRDNSLIMHVSSARCEKLKGP